MTTHVFDRVAYTGRTQATWIPDAYVAGTAAANQFTAGIPRSDASTPVSTPSAADTAISWMSWQMGSTQYDGRCLVAVWRAYSAAGRDISAGLPSGPARTDPVSYRSVAGARRHMDRTPLRGALVFFVSPNGGRPGHVAISLGNGQMISTYDTRTHGIHTMPVSSYKQNLYLGWVAP